MKNILLLSFFVTISTWAQKKHIIEVRVGERVSDLISRLYKKSILSKDAVEQILNENESLNLFDFVPIKGKGTIALEGIFVPGLYNVSKK
jgi:cell division protein YceG involved in septum cleavage